MTDMELEFLVERLIQLGYYPGRETDNQMIEQEKRRRLPRTFGQSRPYRSDGF